MNDINMSFDKFGRIEAFNPKVSKAIMQKMSKVKLIQCLEGKC